jgi:hypothetical protein
VATELFSSAAGSVSRADFLVLNFGNDWLTNMHEINLPEAVSWFAITPLNLGVSFLLMLGVLRVLWRAYSRWNNNLYRRQALQQLEVLSALWSQPRQRIDAAQGLSLLLRQVALTAWPRANVTALLGREWLDFLQRSRDGAEPVPSLLAQLSSLPALHIEKLSDAEWTELLDWAAGWVRDHRVALADGEVCDAGL